MQNLNTSGPSTRKMLTSMRYDDNLTESPNRNKRISNLAVTTNKSKRIRNGEETARLIPGTWSWSDLSPQVASKLSKSVVSLALCSGSTVLFACSGIAVARVGYVTRLVTSASLVGALNGNRSDHGDLKVEVCYEDNVVTGFLGGYYLRHNIAVVNVMMFPDVHFKLFNNPVDFLPCTKVVALGRDTSGKLMTKCGLLTSHSTEDLLNMSTCKISKVCEGGPLFDFDGNFVGMNLLSVEEGTVFMPMWIVLGQLIRFKSLQEIKFPTRFNLYKAVRVRGRLAVEIPDFYQEGEVHKNVLDEDQFGDLESLGYPKPSILNDGMVLVNTFEEPFGDMFGKGVWSKLSEAAISNIRGNVVALATFTGKRRVFACTGFFIDWNGSATILTSASLIANPGYGNTIDENLRIEVLLPSQERKEGTLQYYNLQYNVALVSVKDFCVSHPAKIEHVWGDKFDVVAVGCCFESGRLMAAGEEQIFRIVTLDCKSLLHSTCTITKVGIGGPLVDFDGRFIGMNLYGNNEGTLFLLWRRILSVLEEFKTTGLVGDCSVGPANRNRWPIPVPYWCDPDKLNNHEARIISRGRLQDNLWATRFAGGRGAFLCRSPVFIPLDLPTHLSFSWAFYTLPKVFGESRIVEYTVQENPMTDTKRVEVLIDNKQHYKLWGKSVDLTSLIRLEVDEGGKVVKHEDRWDKKPLKSRDTVGFSLVGRLAEATRRGAMLLTHALMGCGKDPSSSN